MKARKDVLEENLRKLLSSAHEPVEPSLGFQEQLLQQLVTRIEGKRKRPWAKALGTVVATFQIYARPKSIESLLISSAAALGIVLIVFWGLTILTQSATSEQLSVLSVQRGKADVWQTRPILFGLHWTKHGTIEGGKAVALAVGDKIATDDRSQALLTFFEGSTVEAQQGTEFTIEELQLGTGTSPARVVIQVRVGKMVNRVKHLPELRSHFEVKTSILTAWARSTVFRVEVADELQTYVASDEGVVTVRKDEQTSVVHAGEEAYATIGGKLIVQPQQLKLSGEGTTIVTRKKITTIGGRAQPYSTVEIVVDGETAGRVDTDAMGDFRYDLTTPEERIYTISVATLNPNGMVSERSEAVTIVYDHTPPKLLTISSPATSQVLSSPIILAGKTEPGAKVTIQDMEVVADPEGNFSTSLELKAGPNPITVIATDEAGNALEVELIIELKR